MTTIASGIPGLWRGDPVILASGSKGRAQLLANAGIPFDVIPADLDERSVDGVESLSPQQQAVRLASEKARHVSLRNPGRTVIGADQTLAIGTRILHKASSIGNALTQLRELAGREHCLHSAVACTRDGATQFAFVASATIHMRSFSESVLRAYTNAMGDRLLQTVGCYEIEGLGAHLIERIEGDMFTIIGLPIFQLLAGLRHLGLIVEETS